jgi:hypothetical protein
MTQQVRVIITDDLDGSEAAETVRFGLDGGSYEIDLNAAHIAELRDIFAPYVAAGRKTRAVPRRARAARSGRTEPAQAAGVVEASPSTDTADTREGADAGVNDGRAAGEDSRIDLAAKFQAAHA